MFYAQSTGTVISGRSLSQAVKLINDSLILQADSKAWPRQRYLIGEHGVASIHQYRLHGIIEVRVAYPGTVEAREEVGDETQEERNVLKDELGQVHVSQGSHQDHVLTDVAVE